MDRRLGRWALGIVAVLAGALFLYRTALPGDLPAASDDDAGLVGTYTVNGVDPTGVDYGGTVVIRATSEPDTFAITWIVTGAIQEGVGRLTGDELTVDWETVTGAGGNGTGTARYTVGDDGRLVGTRSIGGIEEVGVEEIFPDP